MIRKLFKGDEEIVQVGPGDSVIVFKEGGGQELAIPKPVGEGDDAHYPATSTAITALAVITFLSDPHLLAEVLERMNSGEN